MSFAPARSFILGLFFVVGLSLSVFGQPLQLPFDRLTVEDGLPNPSVLDIFQDREGFLWVGCFSGIARYDGYRFQTYRPGYGERDSLPQRDLPRFYQDREGRLWLGLTYQDCKLYQYEPTLDRFIPFQFDTIQGKGPIPSDNPVTGMIQDKKGRLLVGTLDGGLFVLDLPAAENGIVPVKQHYQPAETELDSIRLNSISGDMAEDAEGNIWIPTEGGLFRWNPDTEMISRFPLTKGDDGTSDLFCHSTLFDPPHTIWVGTDSRGIYRINTKDSTLSNYLYDPPGHPYSPENTGLYGMVKDEQNRLWILSNKAEFLNLSVFDISRGTFTNVLDRNAPMRMEYFNNIFRDRAGNIWLGAWQQGLFKLDPEQEQFQFLQFPQSSFALEKATITAVYQDSARRIWLGTNGYGLTAWDPEEKRFTKLYTREEYPQLFSGNTIFSIEEYAPGKFLLGTERQPIRMEPSQNSLNSIRVFDQNSRTKFWPYSAEKVWATHFNVGLYEVDLNTLEEKLVLKETGLTSLEMREDETVFLGSNQKGLIGYSPASGEVKTYFRNYGIQDIQFDRQGIAWLSTHSAGLIGFDPKTETVIDLPPQIREEIRICRKILQDDQGMLWIITDQGIVSLDPFSQTIKQTYTYSNWLAPGDLWYNEYAAGTKLQDGAFIFGSASGALLFHPDSLHTDTLSPKVNLTDLRIANELISPGINSPLSTHISRAQAISLNHNQNDLSISFSAMLFKTQESYRYRYRLKPVETEWKNAGTRNTAYITNLKPGKYTFEVQAAYGSGAFYEESRQLEVFIRYPWWNSWTAWFTYLLLILILAWGVIRFLWQRSETRRLRELDGLKTRFFTNITHEFRTPLTLILGLTDKLKSILEKTHRTDLQRIENNGQQLLRLINQLLDLSKLEDGSLKLQMVQDDALPFIKYLVEAFRSMADQREIQLVFRSQLDRLQMDFDPDHLQQVIANLLSNALKFTPAGGKVSLMLEQTGNRQALIRVKDTGIGIATEEIDRIFDRFYQTDSSITRKAEGTGIGLSVSKELVELMGGQIKVKSQLGSGTEFLVYLPIRRKAPLKDSVKPPIYVPKQIEDTESSPPLQPAQGDERPLILLVEDNSDLRSYLRTCLQGNYRTIEAANGQSGFMLAEAEIPDLIISDIMMPEMDGFELCRQLKSSTVCSHIPIILLTAKADVESRLEGFELGAEAYLPKPFLKEELLIRVRKLLQLREELKSIYQQWLTEAMAAPVDKIEEPEKDFIRQIRQIVEDNLDDGAFGVSELAQAMEMSRSQLNRKFSQLTDQTPGQFIRLIRMQKAKQLLQNPQLHISEIAYQCGFNDPFYFSKVFKQEEGLSPRDYRRKLN